jgi:hypothetical protein
MALKTTTVTISDGRDKGRKFLITEMPANVAERWILRVVFGLGRSGIELPPELLQLGAAPIAYTIASMVNKIPSRLGLKLADELMEYVQRVEEKLTRSLVDTDIEDYTTRFKLKGEVLKLVFGFFVVAVSQKSDPPGNGTPTSEP